MALHHFPRIVTDNLVLCLDAGNPLSYPGSGNTWLDLAQGINFSSFGTQTPFVTANGAKCFSFNNSGYWSSVANHSLVDMGGDCTLLMWIYSEDVTSRRTIFEKAGTIYASYQQEIAVTWETAESFSYYSRRFPSYDFAGTSSISQNRWHLVVIKMSTGKTSSPRTGFYSMNGANWIAGYANASNTALEPAGAIRIGTGYAGTCNVGKIAAVMCYYKMLSDDEVSYNYNATKGRYGL